MASIRGRAGPFDRIILLSTDGSTRWRSLPPGNAGGFEFRELAPGWYILVGSLEGGAVRFREWVTAVRLNEGTVDVGLMEPPEYHELEVDAEVPVLTVCEALERHDKFYFQPAVIVGVFKSGMDETLRLDCPDELVSGDVGWPGSIGLTEVDQPPESLRDQIEKKRQEILKAAPPNAPLRPERVVGLYGRFVALAGLTATKCCSSQIQTSLPPARLFGVNETDLRVIR